MNVGLIGPGRLGGKMARRLRRHGHFVVGFARTAASVDKLVADGATDMGAHSLADVVAELPSPRALGAKRWGFGGHLKLPMEET